MSVNRFAHKGLLNIRRDYRRNPPPIPGFINLGAGDPDFNQPKFIADAIRTALLEGHSHYVFGGDLKFKEAIAHYYKKFGVEIDPVKQVTLTSGGSQGIFQTFAAVLNHGDDILILNPAYQGYNRPLAYFGAKVVRVNMTKDENGQFRPDISNIEEAVTDRTKALILCSPDNPTGCVYRKKEIEDIAALAVEKDFIVIVDEIYTEFLWGGLKHVPIIGMKGMPDRTIVLMSFSKTFAWTGCRAGYIISGPELSQLISRVPVGICSIPVAFQRAGIEALEKGWDFVEKMRRTYEKRVNYCVKRLNEMPGVRCTLPEGTFYIFPNISELLISSAEFEKGLLKEEKLQLRAGTQYGSNGEGHIRFALVKPLEILEEAMERFERYAKQFC